MNQRLGIEKYLGDALLLSAFFAFPKIRTQKSRVRKQNDELRDKRDKEVEAVLTPEQ
ncbi:MAG: hypothetical protein Tsb009_27510 [Planctomycetaceae bacterium]